MMANILNIAMFLMFFTIATRYAAAIDCSKRFPASRLTSKYNESIAHAVHSMTVDGLKLFSLKASSINYVPTVNQDLSQAETVLSHAPEDPTEHEFSTATMNILDKILSTLGNSKDGLGEHWSPVERVAHVFHMWDLWYKIKDIAWNDVQQKPPTNDVCTCLVAVDINGIKDAVSWVADHYKTGTPITLLNRPIPKLVDSSSWAIWKQRLLHYYTTEALHDAAMYLHCVSLLW